MKTTLSVLVVATAIAATACGGSSSSSSATTAAPTTAGTSTTASPTTAGSPAGGSSTTVAATGSAAFCGQVATVLDQFRAISNPTATDISNAATSFDNLASSGPASLKTSLSATAGDFRQLLGFLKTDPQALTRSEPTPQEAALATKLQGDLTPLVTYQKTCPA